jgi:hypothetical protein
VDYEGHRLHSEKTNLSGEAAEAFAEYGGFMLSRKELKDYLAGRGINWDDKDNTNETIQFGLGFCFELKVYPIFKITLGSKDSLVYKMFKAKVEVEYEIFGEDDVMAGFHVDFVQGKEPVKLQWALSLNPKNFKKFECTMEHTPWPIVDDATEETPIEPDDTENPDYDVTDRIALDTVRYFMNVGEVQYLNITELPSGYTLDDLEIVIENTNVVNFHEGFDKLIAVGEGTTQVVIRTKDKEYKIDLAFTVSSKSAELGSESNGYYC